MKNISMYKDYIIESERNNEFIKIVVNCHKQGVFHFIFANEIQGNEKHHIKDAMGKLRNDMIQQCTNDTIKMLKSQAKNEGVDEETLNAMEALYKGEKDFSDELPPESLDNVNKAREGLNVAVSEIIDKIVNQDLENAVLSTLELERKQKQG